MSICISWINLIALASGLKFEDLIALKSPVWGCPICILWGGVLEDLGHILLSCRWIWLDSFMGQLLFALGLTCIWFVPRAFLSLKWGPCTKNIFSLIFRISFERNNQNVQINPCRLKTWVEFVRQNLCRWKCLLFEAFFSHPLKFVAEWLIQTLQSNSVTTQAFEMDDKSCVVLRLCASLLLFLLCISRCLLYICFLM